VVRAMDRKGGKPISSAALIEIRRRREYLRESIGDLGTGS
jgi:hypothetical protein